MTGLFPPIWGYNYLNQFDINHFYVEWGGAMGVTPLSIQRKFSKDSMSVNPHYQHERPERNSNITVASYHKKRMAYQVNARSNVCFKHCSS